jgi:hypothetical protein
MLKAIHGKRQLEHRINYDRKKFYYTCPPVTLENKKGVKKSSTRSFRGKDANILIVLGACTTNFLWL